MVDGPTATRLAELVASRRQELRLSQADVAHQARLGGLSLSPQTITKIEQGHRDNLRPPVILALAHVFGWPEDWFVRFSEGRPVPVLQPATAGGGGEDLSAIRAELAALRREVRGEGGDEVQTIAAALSILSPEQRAVFRQALDSLED